MPTDLKLKDYADTPLSETHGWYSIFYVKEMSLTGVSDDADSTIPSYQLSNIFIWDTKNYECTKY